MRQLPRRLLSFALAPLILSNAAVASQCTMVLEMRCVWCTTYGRVLEWRVEYEVRSTPPRAARPRRRILVAAGGEKPPKVLCKSRHTTFFLTRSASS